MKIDGACHCGAITIEGEADPEKVGNLSLHGLPDRHRLRLSRVDPGAGEPRSR